MKEGKIKNLINRLKTDVEYRTLLSSLFSIFVTLLFVGYNTALWVIYQATWNISIAIYFLLLVLIRGSILLAERGMLRFTITYEQKEAVKRNLFLAQSIMLFVLDVALVMPISLMVVQQKAVNYTTIPAITVATYTVYKITMSSIGFKKARKLTNLNVRMLKNINFIDAFVSVLTLQYTLIMTFSNDGIQGEMFILCCITSFAIWSLLIAISIFSVVRAAKLRKEPITLANESNEIKLEEQKE